MKCFINILVFIKLGQQKKPFIIIGSIFKLFFFFWGSPAGEIWGFVWLEGRRCSPGSKQDAGCSLQAVLSGFGLCVGRGVGGVCVILVEGQGGDSPDALRKESGSEKGGIKALLLLPQALFPEDAQISQDPGNSRGSAGASGCPCPRLHCETSGSHHLPSKPQS